MGKATRIGAIAGLAIILIFLSGCQGQRASRRASAPEEAASFKVGEITTIAKNVKALDWSHEKDLIAFGNYGRDGYVDVATMKPDGTGIACLTCGLEGLPQNSNGNAAWHPSGDYLIFTAEKDENPPEYKKYGIPGSGFNNDLWVVSSDGSQAWQLTDFPVRQPYVAVIHPQFSHSGDQVLWSQRIANGDSFGGGWALKVADFVIKDGVPSLQNEKTYQPGEESCFYESHGFSADDSKVIFSGDLRKGQPQYGLDIYEMDLRKGKATLLTDSFLDWDEHAHYSPDGRAVAWMSSQGIDIEWGDISGTGWKDFLVTELWAMGPDGKNQVQLTHFNTPGHDEYKDGMRTVVSDSTWGPEGKRIAALVAYYTPAGARSDLVMVELE